MRHLVGLSLHVYVDLFVYVYVIFLVIHESVLVNFMLIKQIYMGEMIADLG